LLLLAGATWQNERYLFMLLPLLYLIGGEVLVRLLDLAPALKRTRPWQPAILALLVALYVGLTGAHLAYRQEPGYDLAFQYLRDHWQPETGDRVLSVSPSACQLYTGGCDYFAIQRGYEEFVVSRAGDGVPVDLWTATPVLSDTAAFVDLLASAPRVWLVTDGWRLQTRYDADFIQTVMDQMEVVHDERGVLVLRGEGYDPPPPPAIQHQRQADFDRALSLEGFGLSPGLNAPGDELEVTLYWQALEEAGLAYTAFLHLLSVDDVAVAGVDEPVLRGLYQPDLWPEGQTFADRHYLALPPDLPPGRYRLDLGLYPSDQPRSRLRVSAPSLPEGADRLPLATLTVGEATEPSPNATHAYLDFGHQIRLLAYDLERSSDQRALDLTLYWQALGPVARDYTVFAHLVDAGGNIIAQDDGPPGDPFFPTSTWLAGDVVPDGHRLALPDGAPAGDYTLLVGLYHQPSGDRLDVTDAHGESQGDAFRLGPISFGSQGNASEIGSISFESRAP
jgi:hypothetical protein